MQKLTLHVLAVYRQWAPCCQDAYKLKHEVSFKEGIKGAQPIGATSMNATSLQRRTENGTTPKPPRFLGYVTTSWSFMLLDSCQQQQKPDLLVLNS